MLAFFCLGARYRPWRYSAAVRSRVFGDGAAPRRTRCSPQPRQHSVFRASGGGVLQVLPSAPFFLRGGRQLFGAGRIQAFVHGKIFTNAFSGDWQWQYTRAVRPQASIRGKFCAPCIPKVASGGNLAIRRRRSALAPATPVPPTSAKPPERPRPRHRRTV